jgi:anti-sigma factor RsiW
MAYLDGEMDEEERARFEEHLGACPRCRSELEKLREVKEVTARMRFVDLEDREWDRYWSGVYNRLERGAGWVLLSLGAIVVFGYGAWAALRGLWADTSLPLFVRVGIGCALAGFVVLFVSVARQRLYSWARDPYRRIKR